MLRFTHPVAFSAFTEEEKEKLYALPWQIIPFSQFKPEKQTFVIVSGYLVSSRGVAFGAGDGPLGTVPFLKQKVLSFKELRETYIATINAVDLAHFFEAHPAAMRSFLTYMGNFKKTVLPEYNNHPLVVTVAARQPGAVSVIAGIKAAISITGNSQKKAIYLEFQRDGISVFSLTGKESKAAILQTENDETLENAFEKRLIKVNEKLDILNVQHLSQFEIDKPQWLALYHLLRNRYQVIIQHLGTEKCDSAIKNSSRIIEVTQTPWHHRDDLAGAATSIAPVFQVVQTTKEKPVQFGVHAYNDVFKDKENITIDELIDNADTGDYFGDNFNRFLTSESMVYIADSIHNLPAFGALHQFLGTEANASTDRDIQLVLEGVSGLLFIASGEEHSKAEQLAEKLQALISKLQPVYPKDAFMKTDKAIKLLETYLTNESNNIPVFFSGVSTANNSNDFQFITTGFLSETALTTAFRPGFAESSLKLPSIYKTKLPARPESGMHIQAAITALRYHYSSFHLFSFAESNDTFLYRDVLKPSGQDISRITGKMIKQQQVPAADNKDSFSEKTATILNFLKHNVKADFHEKP